MTYEQIHEQVSQLVSAMLEKGKVAPDAQVYIRANAQPVIILRWKDDSKEFGTAHTSFSANLESAFEKARQCIADMPTPEQANFNGFMALLGKVIDFGNQNGIDVDFVNPLVAHMKRLSENAITFQSSRS